VLTSNSVFVDLDESPQRAVIGSLDIIRKETGWKLIRAPVILDAFAADALPAAWFIRTVAFLQVLFAVTFFHAKLPQ
jgi:hypothetical protein